MLNTVNAVGQWSFHYVLPKSVEECVYEEEEINV